MDASAPRPTTPDHLEHRIRTRDGRVLAVAEWGDPNGIALFALHGTPGGRIAYWMDPTIYARHGLRRFTLDRPGYGESTRLAGRSVADIGPDIVAIAEQLGVGRFAVTGGSGGGPHALACAALLGDRVLRCLADVSIAPYPAEGLDWLAGMTAGNVEEFEPPSPGKRRSGPSSSGSGRPRSNASPPGTSTSSAIATSWPRPTSPSWRSTVTRSPTSCCTGSLRARTAGSMTTSPSRSRGASMSARSVSRCTSPTAGPTRSSRPCTAIGWPPTSRAPRPSSPTPGTWATMPALRSSWRGSPEAPERPA